MTLRISLISLVFAFVTGAVSAVEVYEFRIYHLNSAENAKKWDAWMAATGVKDFKAAGASMVGAFEPRAMEKKKGEEAVPNEEFRRYVVAVYPSMAAVGRPSHDTGVEVAADKAVEGYLNPEPKAPAFDRVETSLLTAFPSFPEMKMPEGDGGKDRFFEVRIYENPSERTAALKVEMFGEGGEIEIFDNVGLKSVFFGSARVAANFPQLTYMVSHENDEAMAKAWDGFRTSPDWGKLKKVKRYAGTVSKIHKHFMVALPFSDLK